MYSYQVHRMEKFHDQCGIARAVADRLLYDHVLDVIYQYVTVAIAPGRDVCVLDPQMIPHMHSRLKFVIKSVLIVGSGSQHVRKFYLLNCLSRTVVHLASPNVLIVGSGSQHVCNFSLLTVSMYYVFAPHLDNVVMLTPPLC